MIKNFNFVESVDDLTESINEFYSKPEFWKDVLAKNPVYFIHFQEKGKHMFGLSKFCAFKSISVEEYISKYRSETNGTKTKEHIAFVTKQSWIPRNKVDKEIRKAFDLWISDFFPKYKFENAKFITLS